MNTVDPVYSKCACRSCGGHLEFPLTANGEKVDCPHCGKRTTLSAASLATRQLAWRVLPLVFMCLLFAGGAGIFAYLKRERTGSDSAAVPSAANSSPAKVESETINEFSIYRLKLEKTEGSELMYATGSVKNLTARQRFGVKIELDLLDVQGEKIGTTSDYFSVLEPGNEWHFKALVAEGSASSLKVHSIGETQ